MPEIITKRRVLTSFFWKFGERITAQLVSLVVSIVLARILSPDDYGSVTLVMIFITIANVFVSSGLGNALIQKKDADSLDFSSVFYVNIAVSLLIYVILWGIAPIIATFYKMPILTELLRVLGIRIPIAAINSVQQAYVSRNMLFKCFFWSTLFGTLVSGGIGIIMAYHGYGVWSLVAQYLINACMSTIILSFTIKWRPQLKCSFQRVKGLLAFGWKLLLSGLLDTGYNQLRSLVIGKIYTTSDLAYYNQGDKYPSLIVTNVNSSISSVLFPAMSQCQDDTERIKQMTRRAIQVSSYTMWPLMIGLAVVSETFICLLLTEKWLPCVPYLQTFCFSYGLWPIHTANLQALNAMGRSDVFLKLEIIKKIIGIVSLLLCTKQGPLAIAESLLIIGVICTFINATPNIKLLNYSFKEQMSDLLPALVLSIFMAVVIYPISLLAVSDWLILIIQIGVGGVIYLLSTVVLKLPAFNYLVALVKK